MNTRYGLKNSLNELFQAAMRPIMEREAKTNNGLFLTQSEFEKNIHKIFSITNAKSILDNHISALHEPH